MIIDQSSNLRGISIQRLSKYLSLCKIDCLVRNVADATPYCRVDQPDKAGQAITISHSVTPARSQFTLKVDYNLKMGNRNHTLMLKRELLGQSKSNISLSEAGTVILQQDGKDIELIPFYKVTAYADNFAKIKHKEWSFCLVCNKQDLWVNDFLILLRRNKAMFDYLTVINSNQIRNYKVPESRGGN